MLKEVTLMRKSTLTRWTKLAAVVAVLALAGCSTIESWNPFASNKKGRNPPAELVTFKETMKVRSVWQYSIGNSDNFVFSPVVVGDSVIIAGAGGGLARLKTASGKQDWRIEAGSPLTAGVGTDGQVIVVAAEKGVILAYDLDGKSLWKAQVSTQVLSAPAVGNGLVVVRGIDNRITALDVKNGNRKWMVQRPVPALTLRTAPGIAMDAKAAYIGLPGGRLVALSLLSGAVQWDVAVGEPKGATELERIADTSGMPILMHSDVCAVAFQGRIACFDVNNGAPRWTKDLSSDVGIAVDERFVFAADEKGIVSALTRDGGASVWRNVQLGFRRLSTPFSFERAVVVADGQGFIHFLSREDGAFLARVQADKSAVIAAPVLAGANLLFQTQSGTVVALTTE